MIGLMLIHSALVFAEGSGLSQPSADNAINAALQLAGVAIFDKKKAPDVSADQIQGTCSFDGSYCPGAVVRLIDHAGKTVDEQVLSSPYYGFTFKTLPRHEYRIEVDYPRSGLAATSRPATSGNSVKFDLGSARKPKIGN